MPLMPACGKRRPSPLRLMVLFIAGMWVGHPTAWAQWKVEPGTQWKAVDQSDLSIKHGSALDFSFLVEPGPAGQHGFLRIHPNGHFVFEKAPETPLRFLCAPQTLGTGTNFPFNDVEVLAEQIKLAGYNAVRGHFIDQELMTGSRTEGVLNPERLDLWEKYTAALKKRGIYLCLDASSSWAAFTIYKTWDKEAAGVRFKQRFYHDPKARDLWVKGVRQIFEHVNPYTGLAMKDDPQLLFVALRNESGLNFLGPNSDPGLTAPFRLWLQKRYATQSAWLAAWGAERVGSQTFETCEMPTRKDTGTPLADLQRFITDIEQETYLWGAKVLKDMGIKVPIIDYNNGASMQSVITREVLPFIDNHVYHDHPAGPWLSAGQKMEQNNSLERQLGDFRWVIATRDLGKPFAMTEWGGVFWNRYRHEDGLTFPAYAAFQNWSLLAQHATPVAASMGRLGEKASAINPFQVAKDPAAKANERMAALLFFRGDVKASTHQIEVRLDAKTIHQRLRTGDSFASFMTPLCLLSGFGSRVVGGVQGAAGNGKPADLILNAEGGAEIKTIFAAEIAESAGAGDDTDHWVQKLRARGVLNPSNRTDVGLKQFESDSGELFLEAGEKRFTLSSPRSQGFCFHDSDPSGPQAHGATTDVEASHRGPSATLLVSSLTRDPLATTKRILVILSGDALNSNMTFEDESRKTLVSLGTGPALLQTLQVGLTLKREVVEMAYALAQNGDRVEPLPLLAQKGKTQLTLNTGELKNGPTAYFELIFP